MDQKKNKILIVDDDSFLVDMYALKFSQQPNFEVHTALSAPEALEKIHGGLMPDIMLLDILMPGMDGFEFLQKINDEKLAPSSIKIMLSNRGQQSDIERSKTLGATDYIIKASMTPAEVIQKVSDITSKKLAGR